MRIESVAINASPLITLFRNGQAYILPQLFNHIIVPQAVWQEVVLDEWEDAAAIELRKQTWPIIKEVAVSPRVEDMVTRRWRDGGSELCTGTLTTAGCH